jgi:tetratricopeptide (TPR) repeat protein
VKSDSAAGRENMRGFALLMTGKTREAVAAFDRALELDPKETAAAFNRGVALLKLGEHRKAADQFAGIAADESSSYRAAAAYHRAIALDRLSLPAEAEQWLDRALAFDAKYDAALLYKGLLRERRGDSQGAGRAYLDYLKVHPDSTIALLRFGVSAVRAGRPDAARSYLQRVVALAPASDEAAEARKFLVMWE